MILLTGAGGFIGARLLERAASELPFRCLVRGSAKLDPAIPAESIHGDLLERSVLDRATSGVDTVLHLAALIRKDSPAKIYGTNVEGTRRLLEASRKNGVRRFIYLSTENALREDLTDAYADSKRQAEALVRTFPHHLILRPCFVFGSGDDHGLGRLLTLADRWPVVPLFAGLRSQIQPIHIDDMVEYLLRALRTDIQGEYLVAGRDKMGINDLLREYCRLHGKRRVFLPLPAFLYRSLGMSSTQLRNIYHSRTYSIERTVKDFQFEPGPLEAGLRATNV